MHPHEQAKIEQIFTIKRNNNKKLYLLNRSVQKTPLLDNKKWLATPVRP